jgi:hypothetical protein
VRNNNRVFSQTEEESDTLIYSTRPSDEEKLNNCSSLTIIHSPPLLFLSYKSIPLFFKKISKLIAEGNNLLLSRYHKSQ